MYRDDEPDEYPDNFDCYDWLDDPRTNSEGLTLRRIIFTALLLGLAFIAMMLIAGLMASDRAQAQETSPCGPTEKMEAYLAKQYGESPRFAGVVTGPAGSVPMLAFSNPETGTFTVTVRRPGGITCFVMGGSGYTEVPQMAPGQGT